MKIAVIGGGPAGCNVAGLLALQGHRVDVYEEHDEIGSPVQCTGLLSHSIVDHIDLPKDAVQNIIRNVRIHGPGVDPLLLRFNKPDYVIDRRLFDRHLAKKAESLGAVINLGMKMTGLDRKGLGLRFGKKVIRPDLVIGADGPASKVSEIVGQKRGKYWTGIQGIYRVEQDNAVDFFPYIGTLAWKVPQGRDTVRVGVIAEKNTKRIFDRFASKVIGNRNPIAVQGGIIPVYDKRKTCFWDGRVFLIGDAAGQVKATTGGGIIQGIQAGKILASCIRDGKEYDSSWRSEMGMDLWAHRRIREVLDKFPPEEYSRLIRKLRKSRKVLEKIEREYPIRLALSLLLRDPCLLTYLRYLF